MIRFATRHGLLWVVSLALLCGVPVPGVAVS